MNSQLSYPSEQSLSLGDVWRVLAPIKWTLIAGAVLGAVLGWGASRLIHPIYRATTTMLPTKSPESSNGLGGIATQVGGLAALAGINLQPNDNSVGSGEYLRSNTLMGKFIDSHDLMPILYPNRWDGRKHEGIPGRFGGAPTESAAIRRLKASVVKISEDKRTGLLTVTVDWRDPALARQWANDFVALANNGLRTRAIVDAQATIDYLNGQIEKTQSVQIREALYRIVETQLKTLALANVREDYAFRVVDAAVLPDDGSVVSPKRWLFTAFGLLFGACALGWVRSKFSKA
jgi:uncharacterized protein involved in exopolysaccharide biosynthesis